MTKRSDQEIALGRCPTRVCRIGRLRITAEMFQNPIDDGWVLDAGDHLELPAAAPADLDVDRKDTFEALRPGQRPLSVAGRWLAGLDRLAGSNRARFGHDPCPLRARRRKHAVISRQMGAGFWHQRSESGHKVFGLKDHVRGAIPIRCLQCQAHEPVLGRRRRFACLGSATAFPSRPAALRRSAPGARACRVAQPSR